MGLSRNRLKIFLADLTHSTNLGATIPLNIGLIASYALKKFNSEIDVKLFKYPEKLLRALRKERCDILGSSNYVWNSNLGHWACKVAKERNPNVLTCMGGPNFPLLENQKIHFLKEKNYVDIMIPYEGEIAFANILERILKDTNREYIFRDAIDGCTFLSPDKKKIVEGNIIYPISKLDSIPSPYTSGLLDEFFDGKLLPMIQTARGCPYSCNYCNIANSYYSKVKSFETQYIKDELHYIAERVSNTSIKMLQIADSNYGMYKKDKDISKAIKKLQEKYNWPQGIYVSTGKKFDNVIENTEIIKNSFGFSMSVQSMNKTVLKEIGRSNIPIEDYKSASDILTIEDQPTLAEYIFPLPYETFKSYMNGVKELIDLGVKRIVTNTLMVLNGTIYKDNAYKEKFGYVTKYRILPYCYGIYEGEKVFEYEEVGISTNTLSINEYLKIREFSFLMEILFNSSIFIELWICLKAYGLDYYDFLKLACRELENAHGKIRQIFTSFNNEAKNELKDSSKSVVEFYSKKANYQKLIEGEIGVNVVFHHKAMLLINSLPEWIEFAFNCLRRFIKDEKKIDANNEFEEMSRFVTCKLESLLDLERTEEDIKEVFHYDFKNWLNQKENILPITMFRTQKKVCYRFYYNRNQAQERNDILKQCSGNSFSDLSRIMFKIRPLERLYRNVELVDG
jgi:radical SAM superfamily enzyme YgiQ (UPF0313 family)